jgi:hypothetical protein
VLVPPSAGKISFFPIINGVENTSKIVHCCRLTEQQLLPACSGSGQLATAAADDLEQLQETADRQRQELEQLQVSFQILVLSI